MIKEWPDVVLYYLDGGVRVVTWQGGTSVVRFYDYHWSHPFVRVEFPVVGWLSEKTCIAEEV